MRSYKDYTKTTEGESAGGASAEELAKKLASAYNGKSNAVMLRQILAEAEKSKRAGTLSNEELEGFYRSFSPMVSPTQRRQLREVVEKLKKI